MLFKRKGTNLLYNVTNEALIPLYKGNEAYLLVEDEPKTEEAEKPKKSTKKKG